MNYYIRKKGAGFWKDNDCGYTDNIEEAKVFTLEQAEEICSRPYSDKEIVKAGGAGD